jgi:hypothetical protein
MGSERPISDGQLADNDPRSAIACIAAGQCRCLDFRTRPNEPVAIFWSTDRSTLEPVARRARGANQRSATAVIRGRHPTIGTRLQRNDRTRKSQTFAHSPWPPLLAPISTAGSGLSESPPEKVPQSSLFHSRTSGFRTRRQAGRSRSGAALESQARRVTHTPDSNITVH